MPSPSQVAKLTVGLVPLQPVGQVVGFWKPQSEAHNDLYQVNGLVTDPSVNLGFDFEAGPGFLELSTEGSLRITAVGFLKLEAEPPPPPAPQPVPQQYKQEGPCGGDGSFFLTASIPRAGSAIVEVRDIGLPSQFGYILGVWLNNGQTDHYFDPRVYNHGIVGHGHGRRISWWQRLLRALRRLFGGG